MTCSAAGRADGRCKDACGSSWWGILTGWRRNSRENKVSKHTSQQLRLSLMHVDLVPALLLCPGAALPCAVCRCGAPGQQSRTAHQRCTSRGVWTSKGVWMQGMRQPPATQNAVVSASHKARCTSAMRLALHAYVAWKGRPPRLLHLLAMSRIALPKACRGGRAAGRFIIACTGAAPSQL